MNLVEPLRDFLKDEVRAIGRFMGLGEGAVAWQPLSGLAARRLGEVTPARFKAIRMADEIVTYEIESAGCRSRTSDQPGRR